MQLDSNQKSKKHECGVWPWVGPKLLSYILQNDKIKYAEKIRRMEIFVKFLSQKKKPPRLRREEIDSRVVAAGLEEVSRNFWNLS